MIKPNYILCAAVLLLACLFNPVDSLAQTVNKSQAEPNYDIVLHILLASNAANDKSTVSPTLAETVKKLTTNYSFTNYSIGATYIQRIANTGSATSNEVSNESIQNQNAPVFSDWAIDQFLTVPDAKNQDSVSIRNFRFGQRIPIRNAALSEGEKSNGVINYERVGLTVSRLNLPINTPTVVGNLSKSKPDESAFLILTVRPVDE